jgi:membrane-associated protease RseP (regulator of RpoE activity)
MWESPEIPEVSRVDSESPAGRAGIRSGDRITHVDGLSITSPEGARRFGSAEPGQRVRLTIKRGNNTLQRDVVVGTRPEARAAIAAAAPRSPRTPRTPAPPSVRRRLRYTGQIDNVSVEVWSPGGPTIDRIGDTMVITVGTSVVRIKVDPKKSP